ncbi:MAG: thioesterase family protein [Peptococcaceae bacterium]|nr:thioesterase family protein [Peptococcaceae bacterium]
MTAIIDKKMTIAMATLESRFHEVNAIKSGVKLHNAGMVQFSCQEDDRYYFRVEDKFDTRTTVLVFTRDGCDLDSHFCSCGIGSDGECLCKHIVASVLTLQGGVIESKLALGKTATVNATVTDANTAIAVGSGSLDVFATPMMIALMEHAACECLADGLEPGQTSVGTRISVSHIAASHLGAAITATATIDSVSGRKIDFVVSAADGTKEIGNGKHSRMIVDADRFMEKSRSL